MQRFARPRAREFLFLPSGARRERDEEAARRTRVSPATVVSCDSREKLSVAAYSKEY